MTKLYLIRHAFTPANNASYNNQRNLWKIAKDKDMPIEKVYGVRQALELGEFLGKLSGKILIYVSPYYRVRQTLGYCLFNMSGNYDIRKLDELYELVSVSLEDLELHLQKEENVLFPYLLELFEASEKMTVLAPMHCGTIANPIRVMHMEHEAEGNRYFHIKDITRNFEIPEDGCNTYRLMMKELEAFVSALFEHIHIENNILFPKSMELENKWVR